MAATEGKRTAQRELTTLDAVHIDDILQLTVDRDSSDLHLCVGVPPIIRIDGKLYRVPYHPATAQQTQRMVYEILTDEQIQTFEQDMELDFSYSLHNIARFRVNVYKDRGNIAAALRLIPRQIPTISELGLPEILQELIVRPRGLILVTGPTGSGKSTTLAAMIDFLNTSQSEHIITVEDPIEYLHTHKKCIINQRELGQDTRSFEAALRASLREDPDVILVGEMRDPATMAIAITAAETGHLVLATLHTNTAAESVDRVVDVFPAGQQNQIRVQLSNNLAAILSQQLLPKVNGKGRAVAMEIMIATSGIRNLVREAKSHQITSLIQTGTADGMQTMDQALRDLYMQGAVSYEEVTTRAVSVDELKKMLAGPETDDSSGRS